MFIAVERMTPPKLHNDQERCFILSALASSPFFLQIAERVRDAYRVAWGLPWAKSVMSRAPNSSLAFTPLVSAADRNNVSPPDMRWERRSISYNINAENESMHLEGFCDRCRNRWLHLFLGDVEVCLAGSLPRIKICMDIYFEVSI